MDTLGAFSRHAPLPLLFRGFQAITGRDKPVCTGDFQHSWWTRSALSLLDIRPLIRRTRLSRVHRRGLQQDGLGGVFISLSHPLIAAPQSGAGYSRLTCISLLDITGTNVYRPLLSIRSISVDWL